MYPLKPFKLSLPIRQRTSVQSDALRKKNPRRGIDFLKWADADSVINIISHVYAYAQTYMDPEVPGGKEHFGYIVNWTGPEAFLRRIMKDLSLPPKAEVCTPLYWNGIRYFCLK